MTTSLINVGGQVVDASSVTVPADRIFRGAWQLVGNAIEIDVDMAKLIANDKVVDWRKEQATLPFTVDNLGEFSADGESKANIDGASQGALMATIASAPFSIVWSLSDGSPITLDAAQMQAVGLALLAHINTAHVAARGKTATINSATTMLEIETVLETLSL